MPDFLTISESELEAANCVAKKHAYRMNDFDFETPTASGWMTIMYWPTQVKRVYQTGLWLPEFERDLRTRAYGSFPPRKTVADEE